MSKRSAIGRFTLGVLPEAYRLPHPRLPLATILLVRRVVMHAFAVLRSRNFAFTTAKEDEITIALVGVIENDLRKAGTVRGFNRQTFDQVLRHKPVENYNFVHPQKAPDICFKLRDDQEYTLSVHNALFIECKPVDADHAAGGDYCDKGLVRYIIGDYAWAMQDALMIGYSRQRRSLETHLIPAMSTTARQQSLKTTEMPIPLSLSAAAGDDQTETLHRSIHERDFPWPDDKGSASSIRVYHSWHCCD